MSDETKAELKKLIDQGDVYGLMLASNRACIAKYHPSANSAALIVDMGRRAMPIQIPIISSGPEGAEPGPVRLPARLPA